MPELVEIGLKIGGLWLVVGGLITWVLLKWVAHKWWFWPLLLATLAGFVWVFYAIPLEQGFRVGGVYLLIVIAIGVLLEAITSRVKRMRAKATA